MTRRKCKDKIDDKKQEAELNVNNDASVTDTRRLKKGRG